MDMTEPNELRKSNPRNANDELIPLTRLQVRIEIDETK
jgi:hypothetical protein